jgi:hypothetical protein
VPPESADPWHLDRFDERLDWWIRDTNPPQDLVIIVLAWVVGLRRDPFRGMHRVEGFADHYFGRVPNSDNGAGVAVTCSFMADEETRTIRCDLFGTLTLPI